MRVVETALRGKRPDESRCEDVVVVTEHFAAVIDGFTDRSGTTYDGVSGGRFASRTLAEAVGRWEPGISAPAAVAALTTALASATPVVVPGERGLGFGRPCAVAVVFSRARREVWRVGDAPFRMGDELHVKTTAVNRAAAAHRRALVVALLAGGADPEELRAAQVGFAALQPLMDAQSALGNRTDSDLGYPVLDGTPVPDELVEVYAIGEAQEVVLASDGYPELLGTLAASEARLAALLAADPLGIDELASVGKEWDPANCSYDDRAYLRLDVSEAVAA